MRKFVDAVFANEPPDPRNPRIVFQLHECIFLFIAFLVDVFLFQNHLVIGNQHHVVVADQKIPVGQNAVCQKISGNIQFSAVLIGRLLEFILVQLLVMLQLLFSPRIHRPEFQEIEYPVVASHPLGTINRRAFAFQSDCQHRQQQQRRQRQQSDRRETDVEKPFP